MHDHQQSRSAVEDRLVEALAARAPEEARRSRFWDWLRYLFRKWSPEFRAAKRQYAEDESYWHNLAAGLPEPLRQRYADVVQNAEDLVWFRVMEEADLLCKMDAAVFLGKVFAQSKWTKWDRATLAQSEDHATVYRGWRYLVQDLTEVGKELPEGAADFAWKDFTRSEILEIFGLLEVLLD